ncbi:MAG: Zn-dependent hydrolase [Chloroflexota bacterium]
MIPIDATTLLHQLNALGAIGLDGSGGRTRLAASDADKAGRDTLVAWMHDLNLVVSIDQIGNIIGLWTGQDVTLAPIMLGSHIDTVIHAGAYDGCYGVLAGLAVIRALKHAGVQPRRGIAVVAFTNEEGVRYQPDMMGSLVYAGGMPVDDALNVIGVDGTRLGDELARIGYAGALAPGAIVPHCYLELHIEQGPILDTEGIAIGAVANLQGISWQKLTIHGTANHAGTTPLPMRHDAGVAAAAIITKARQSAQAHGTTLATIGSMQFEPNAINVIPNKVTMTVDLRNPDNALLIDAEQQLAAFMAEIADHEGVTIEREQLARFDPVQFDADIVGLIDQTAQRHGFAVRRMTSGAGHDAQMMARITPAAMIFVPSRDGISHNPAEFTTDADIIAGAQVLLDVVQTVTQ